MVPINALHACTSYSCLLELEEAPNFRSFSFSPTASSAPLYRPQSPATVIIENDCAGFDEIGIYESEDDENDIDDADMINLRSVVSLEESLKDAAGERRALPRHSTRGHVNFSPKVAVNLIPSHKDYTLEMKDRIWTSMEQIRINAVKHQMEIDFLGNYVDDDEGMDDEPKFIPLGSLKRTRDRTVVPPTC